MKCLLSWQEQALDIRIKGIPFSFYACLCMCKYTAYMGLYFCLCTCVSIYVYSCVCDYFRVVMCTCVNVYGYFYVCRYICVHMFYRFFLCTVVHVCMCLCGGKRGSLMCGSFSDFHLLFWDRFLTGLGLVPVEI